MGDVIHADFRENGLRPIARDVLATVDHVSDEDSLAILTDLIAFIGIGLLELSPEELARYVYQWSKEVEHRYQL